MIFNIERQQRNYNYLEIIREFNKSLDLYDKNSIFNRRDFYRFIENIKGIDTADEIYEALLPSDDDIDNPNELELFYEMGENRYQFAKTHKILLSASKEEAVAVYSMLRSGNLDLYLDKKDVIENNVLQYFDNIDTVPIDVNDYIEIKGRSKLRDSVLDIKERFKILQIAIRDKRFVGFSYHKGKKPVNITAFPVKMIFSQLDERFRVKAICDDNRYRTFYLSLMDELSVLPEAAFDIRPITEKSKELVFRFKNEKGLAERVCARFSDYKKQVKYNKKDNTLTYKVQYADTPLENNRIIIRLLSLGSNLEIFSDEKKIIKDKAKKTLEQYTGTISGK